MMLEISPLISIHYAEIELNAIRAQGAGGQNINKVSTAIHLRFDIQASSLPDDLKERLRVLTDRRICGDGVIIIKAQRYRSQDKNREDALLRLQVLLASALFTAKPRTPTKPTRSSTRKRLEGKTKRGELKLSRGKVTD